MDRSTTTFNGLCWVAKLLLLLMFVLVYASLNAQSVDMQSRGGENEAEERQSTASSSVELSEFYGSALNCYARLVWSSTLEEDFDHYVIEWSDDGITYHVIATIEGVATTNGFTYNFTDDEAGHHNYYRLRMVNLNGTYSYSEVVFIDTGCPELFDIAVHPNPVAKHDGVINVQFFAMEKNAMLTVTDVNGKLVKQVNIGVDEAKTWNSMQLDISDLYPGMYFLNAPGSKAARAFLVK